MNHLELILAMIDEIWKSIEKDLRRRPGPKPIIHDADIIKLIILRNLLGFRHESSFLRFMETFELKRFFPLLPCQSRFNRRSKLLKEEILMLETELLKRLKADALNVRVIDTTPVPMVKLVRKNQSKIVALNDLKVGYCSSQRYFYIGISFLSQLQ